MAKNGVLAVTEAIYGAAAGDLPWPVVEGGLKRLIEANTAVLMAGDVASGQVDLLWRDDFPDDAVAAYRGHYRHVDLWTTRAAAALGRDPARADGPIRVRASGDGLVPDQELLRSEFYVDYGRRLGLRYVIGTVVPLGQAGMMPIGLHRPDGARPFGARERALLERVLPHLRRGLQLRHRLRAAEAAAGLAALDALPGGLGVLVLDAAMGVVVANAAAEALAAAPGAALRLRRARVPGGVGAAAGTRAVAAAAHLGEAARLAALVRGVAAPGGDGGDSGGAMRLRAEDGSAALAALVSPLPRRLAPGGGGGGSGLGGRVPGQALVLLRDLSAGAVRLVRPELLRELFGLSRAEAEVARALAGGATKGGVAAARGLKETTVRTQVAAVLDKTGAANLRDLERLLAGLQGM